MIIVVVGPSGSGKSLFIRMALSIINNSKAIEVDVCCRNSRNYDVDIGRRSIEFKQFSEKRDSKSYSCCYEYDENLYGVCVPFRNEDYMHLFFDYPGEYPACNELNGLDWIGVLIMPPSQDVLQKRLIESNRSNRIHSSLKEYVECLEDIKNGKFNIRWLVVINSSINDLNIAINTLSKMITLHSKNY